MRFLYADGWSILSDKENEKIIRPQCQIEAVIVILES